VRSAGRVAELASQASSQHVGGRTGIAHTRWATHGAPTERNAHPHLSGDVAIVHNGIVENYEAIRERLTRAGYEFVSDTDTEVVAHLIAEYRKSAESRFAASVRALGELQGAFALGVVWARSVLTATTCRRRSTSSPERSRTRLRCWPGPARCSRACSVPRRKMCCAPRAPSISSPAARATTPRSSGATGSKTLPASRRVPRSRANTAIAARCPIQRDCSSPSRSRAKRPIR